MPLDVKDIAKRTAVDDAFELAHRCKAAPVVAATKGHAGIPASRDGPLGPGTGERERLFAPHRLSGCSDRNHLLHMKRVGRGKKDRVDLRIAGYLREHGRQGKAMPRGKIACLHRIAHHAADKTDAVQFALDRRDECLTPASETANGGVDHGFLNFNSSPTLPDNICSPSAPSARTSRTKSQILSGNVG